MKDRIFIKGLSLHAYHGVMKHEGKVGQTFKLDVTLHIDLSDASRSDKVADTASYDEVADIVGRAFCAQRYKLVEAAAGAVADALLERFTRISALEVTVHKPHAPVAATFDDVGVSILRVRQDIDDA